MTMAPAFRSARRESIGLATESGLYPASAQMGA